MDQWMLDVTARLKNIEALCCGGKPAAAGHASGGVPVAAAAAAPSANGGGAKPRPVVEWEALMSGPVADFRAKGTSIGGRVGEATEIVYECFSKEGEIVAAICACRSPEQDMDSMQALVKPVGDLMMKAGAMDKGKSDPHFNHIKLVAESLAAMSWVCYSKDSGMSLPGPFVKESWESAEFYANKVIMENRGKHENHVEWAKALKAVFQALGAYVKDCHTTGPTWNSGGVTVAEHLKKGPAGAVAANGVDAQKAGLLSALNSGADVTKGLKKVTADMKTKNMKDRPAGAIPASKPKAGATFGGGAKAPAVKKEPKHALEGNTWIIENFENEKPIKVEGGKLNQKVYVYKCKGSLIQVDGKVNAITLDGCNRSQLVLNDVVSTVEIVNCSSVEVQVTGSAPTITIDKTDGCQLYLSRKSMSADILSAKSSEMNVLVPGATDDDDLIEFPLPEQYKTKWNEKSKSFVTSTVSSSDY